jgi:hypothetical protein
VGEAATGAEQSIKECGRTGEGKSRVGDDLLGDVWSSGKEGPTHVGSDDWWPPGTGAARGTGRPSRRSNKNGPLTCGPDPLTNFSNFQTTLKFVNAKRKLSHAPKIFNLCMGIYMNILNNFLHWIDF